MMFKVSGGGKSAAIENSCGWREIHSLHDYGRFGIFSQSLECNFVRKDWRWKIGRGNSFMKFLQTRFWFFTIFLTFFEASDKFLFDENLGKFYYIYHKQCNAVNLNFSCRSFTCVSLWTCETSFTPSTAYCKALLNFSNMIIEKKAEKLESRIHAGACETFKLHWRMHEYEISKCNTKRKYFLTQQFMMSRVAVCLPTMSQLASFRNRNKSFFLLFNSACGRNFLVSSSAARFLSAIWQWTE